MAYFFGDGFDLYTTITDCANYWDGAFGNGSTFSLSTNGRFTGSRSILGGAFGTPAPYMTKTSNSNDTIHHVSVAYQQNSVSGNSTIVVWITLYDGGTAQCSICFNSNGSIQLMSGAYSGTVLATYNSAVISPNIWYQFEFEVVINNTTGSFAVRKNGNVTNDFSATSLNTRSSTNNYANKIGMGAASSTYATGLFDDFLWRSDPSSVPWVGDIRCYTRMPVSDVAVQFSKTTTTNTQQTWGQTGIGNTFSANEARYMQFTPTYSGSVASVSFNANAGGGTGHTKAALFASTGTGAVGTILATSAEITNPAAATITFTFPTPGHVTIGQQYWIGIIQDASMQYNVINSSSNTPPTPCIMLTTTPYASWPVATPGGTITTFNIPGSMTVGYVPLANADAVGEAQQDAANSYVYSSTNGQSDLYAIAAIGNTPTTTIAVTTRGYFQKSDAGTRNATIQVKSGSTTVQGVSTALPAGSWQWISRTDVTDPATGAAWTATGVNNLQIGPVVTA